MIPIELNDGIGKLRGAGGGIGFTYEVGGVGAEVAENIGGTADGT